MNLFFGFEFKNYLTKITIPKFQNRNNSISDYDLYQARITKNKWTIENVSKQFDQDHFYIITPESINNKTIFFLAKDNEVTANKEPELLNYNSYTNTSPEYRANLQVSRKEGGYSSYQSDYPFHMATKTGNIASSCSTLLNKDADENYLIFKNIYHLPIYDEFKMYFVNIKEKEILTFKQVYTNVANVIKIDEELINPDIYLFTDKYIGIPIFLSNHNNHLSFEHTHPPHSFVMGSDQFKIISKFKKEIREIIT